MDFIDPSCMDDDELLREVEALQGHYDELMESDVSPYLKQQITEHSNRVNEEMRRRENDSEWIYPLYSFGLFDF